MIHEAYGDSSLLCQARVFVGLTIASAYGVLGVGALRGDGFTAAQLVFKFAGGISGVVAKKPSFAVEKWVSAADFSYFPQRVWSCAGALVRNGHAADRCKARGAVGSLVTPTNECVVASFWMAVIFILVVFVVAGNPSFPALAFAWTLATLRSWGVITIVIGAAVKISGFVAPDTAGLVPATIALVLDGHAFARSSAGVEVGFSITTTNRRDLQAALGGSSFTDSGFVM